MKIANILATHSFFPDKLLASVDRSIHDPAWLVFFHGHNENLQQEIAVAVQARNGRYFPYGEDRGLARSWNEAIKIAISDKCDLIFLLNDDLFFYDDGYDCFVDFCAKTISAHPTVGVIFTNGLESGESPYAGKVQQQGFACCCLVPHVVDKVGYFDENFKPAYFEDIDFNRRLSMAGLNLAVCEETLVEHERSLTMRLDPGLAAANAKIYEKCRLYYVEKWGGAPGTELYNNPFNNEAFGYKIDGENTTNPYKKTIPPSVKNDQLDSLVKVEQVMPAIVYLLREADGSWQHMATNFLQSFVKHRPGIPFTFHLLLKGFKDSSRAEAIAIFSSLHPTIIHIVDEGYDIASYFAAASLCPAGPICFLNSHSIILCSYWLAKLKDVFDQAQVGMVGATGSYERQAHDECPPFPNKHLRTTCFMIDRDEFLQSHSSGKFATKMDAFIFESGSTSLTQYFLGKGRRVCVVGRDGLAYDPEMWPDSNTFRAGHQHNLLVGDNHTRFYENSDADMKKRLATLAWGDRVEVET